MSRRQRYTSSVIVDEKPVSLLVVEHVARSTRKWTLVFAWLFAANLIAALAGVVPTQAVAGCLLWGALALHRFDEASSVLRVAAKSSAFANLCGNQLVVRWEGGEARLFASARQLAAARRRAVPEARTA